MLNVTQQAIYAWEKGNGFPNPDTLIKLAEIFGVITDYLLGKETNFDKPLELSEKIVIKAIIDAMKKMGRTQSEIDVLEICFPALPEDKRREIISQYVMSLKYSPDGKLLIELQDGNNDAYVDKYNNLPEESKKAVKHVIDALSKN